MADYKSQQIGRGSISDILQLLEAFSSGHQRAKQDSIAFQGRINDIRTLGDLNNILPVVQDHNEALDISGQDEYSVNYNDRHQAFKNATSTYNKGISIVKENLNNPDILAKDLLKNGWEGAAAGILDMDNMLDDISEAAKYNFKYVGDGEYSQTAISNAITQRRDAYLSVQELLDDPDNAENFLKINPDGTVDEYTQSLLEKLKFNIVTGDVQEVTKTINDGTTVSIRDYNTWSKQYVKWNNAQLQHGPENNSLSDMKLGSGESYDYMLSILDAQGKSDVDPLELDFISQMKTLSLENAKKANNRHKIFTGEIYDKAPVWKDYEFPEDPGVVGMGPDDKDVTLDNLSPHKFSELGPWSGGVSDALESEKIDVTPVKTEVKSEVQSRPGTTQDKKLKQADIKADKVLTLMPEISLKSETRDSLQSELEGIYNKRNIITEDLDALNKDVETIISTVGGRGKRGDEFTELERLAYEHNLSDGLLGLQKIIDKYQSGKFTFTTKNKIAFKIVSRYNTILNKLKKRVK